MTNPDILFSLQVAIAILLLIVLYNTIFIVVRIRSITKRIDTVSKDVEKVVVQPLQFLHAISEIATSFLEKKPKKSKK